MEQSLLADVFDAHVRHDFVEQDVDATMQTMTAEPYLLYLPTLPGGERRQAVRRFYEQLFVGKRPADSKVVRLSGRVGSEQTVDDFSSAVHTTCRCLEHRLCPLDYVFFKPALGPP